MFYQIVSFVLLLVGVLGAPPPSPTGVVPLEKDHTTVIPILSQSEEVESNGTFKFSYETGNGIKWEESSYNKVLPKIEGRSGGSGEDNDTSESDEIHVQRGSYSYTAPDGTLISLSYIADENGFQPVGSHIPTPPSPLSFSFGTNKEKSGRALKASDSASAPSAPVAVASAAPKPTKEASKPTLSAAAPTVDAKSGAAEVSTTETSSAEASTTAATRAEETTTAAVSTESSSSAEEAPSTTSAPAASTTEAESSSTTTA